MANVLLSVHSTFQNTCPKREQVEGRPGSPAGLCCGSCLWRKRTLGDLPCTGSLSAPGPRAAPPCYSSFPCTWVEFSEVCVL